MGVHRFEEGCLLGSDLLLVRQLKPFPETKDGIYVYRPIDEVRGEA